jgi:hypothetical protein
LAPNRSAFHLIPPGLVDIPPCSVVSFRSLPDFETVLDVSYARNSFRFSVEDEGFSMG